MNILVSLLRYPPDYSGAGQRTHMMYANLRKKGAGRVYVITTAKKHFLLRPVKRDGIIVFYIGNNRFSQKQVFLNNRLLKAAYILRSAFVLAKVMLRLRKKIDIMHSIGACWLTTLIGWSAFILRKPLVKETVLLGYDDPLSICKAKNKALAGFFLFPFKYAQMVVVISPPLKEACMKFGIDEEKIWCRHNPVYFTETSLPGAFGSGNPVLNLSAPVILWVGGLGRRKNLEFLLNAAKYLKSSLQLYFIGPVTDKGYFKELTIQAQDVMRSTDGRINIHFTGMVSDRGVLRSIYKRSSLFWFSSHDEGLGNVIIESLLCGTPVVTLPVNGVMDFLIRQPQDGRIVETSSPEVFAEEVENCLAHSVFDRKEIELSAQKRFNPFLIEDEYLARFRSIIKAGERGNNED